MTARKDDIRPPRGDRPPAYVDRETGAAELRISPATWDDWVEVGILPKPIMTGVTGTTPRWRWADVDLKISGKKDASKQAFMAGIDTMAHGKKKGDRGAAS